MGSRVDVPDPKDPTRNITRQVVIPDVVVVDLVEVPNLPPGDYVLQYRHDCEQTPQVWNSCADLRLV